MKVQETVNEPQYVDRGLLEGYIDEEVTFVEDFLICGDVSIAKYKKGSDGDLHVLALCGDMWSEITSSVYNALRAVANSPR